MVTFEEQLETLMNLSGFQSYEIVHWDSYSATVNYWVNNIKDTNTYIDDGTGNWIEVQG